MHTYLSSVEKKFYRKYYQSVKQFRSRSGETFVGPDLGPNYLQRLSADDTSRQRVMRIPIPIL